jgi:Uma2 family endonuclease
MRLGSRALQPGSRFPESPASRWSETPRCGPFCDRWPQTILGNLYFLIRTWLEQHPVGRAFMAPLDVTQFDVVEPDLLFVSTNRAADILTAEHVTGAPDIVVEIGSPSTRKRDETIKRRLYERSGVSE